MIYKNNTLFKLEDEQHDAILDFFPQLKKQSEPNTEQLFVENTTSTGKEVVLESSSGEETKSKIFPTQNIPLTFRTQENGNEIWWRYQSKLPKVKTGVEGNVYSFDKENYFPHSERFLTYPKDAERLWLLTQFSPHFIDSKLDEKERGPVIPKFRFINETRDSELRLSEMELMHGLTGAILKLGDGEVLALYKHLYGNESSGQAVATVKSGLITAIAEKTKRDNVAKYLKFGEAKTADAVSAAIENGVLKATEDLKSTIFNKTTIPVALEDVAGLANWFDQNKNQLKALKSQVGS